MKKVILAKKFNDIGSIAFNVEDDKTVSDTYPFLSKKSMYSDVQIVVIGGIENYKEYEPIIYIKDSADFIIKVLNMIKGIE